MIRRKLKTRGIDDSWGTIQRELNKWQRGDVVLEKTKRKDIVLSTDAKPNEFQRTLVQLMHIPISDLGRKNHKNVGLVNFKKL